MSNAHVAMSPRAGVAWSDKGVAEPVSLIERLIVISGEVGSAHSSRILVDSGATSNFIADSFVRQHGLVVSELPTVLNVRMANGEVENCQLVLRQVTVRMVGYEGRHSFVVLPTLDSFDVILGRSFLKQADVLVLHGSGEIAFGGISASSRTGKARKIKLLKCTSQLAQFTSLVTEVVEGLDTCSQDGVLRALGLCAESVASEPVSTSLKVSSKVYEAVMRIVAAYEERMKPFLGQLPPLRDGFDHTITLVCEDESPKARRAIPLNHRHQQALAKELDRLLAAGYIRVSRSPWAAPVFFVPKNETEDRMVCDYRALNSVTTTNGASLPYVKELFARLQGSVVFTKLDLTSGYHQLRVREEDIALTGFITPHGHFEWVVMPFGEKNAPGSFAQLMNQLVLRDLVHTFVIVFQDDMLIASKSDADHPAHVEQVLQRLSDHRLWIKPQKCQWAVREVDFLGHHIRATELGTVIEPMQSKVEAVKSWPTPRSTSELRSFLGMANFYRDFVQDFSSKAASLTSLTGLRVPFEWRPHHDEAFEVIKSAMCHAPALLTVNDDRQFFLHCDASSFAVGAVLSQRDEVEGKLRPVAFFSRKLTDTQLRWDVYEREIFSVVAALENWHMHLKGTSTPIQIYTDHRSLEELAKQLLRPKMARWLTFLCGFNYEVTWIPAAENVAADALSRRPDHDDGSVQRRVAQTAVAQQLHVDSGNSLGPGQVGSNVPCAPTAIQRSPVLASSAAPAPRPASAPKLASISTSASAPASAVPAPVSTPAPALASIPASTSAPVPALASAPAPASTSALALASIPASASAPAPALALASTPALASVPSQAPEPEPALPPVVTHLDEYPEPGHSCLGTLAVSCSPRPFLDQIRQAYGHDEQSIVIMKDPQKHGYRLVDGLLMRHGDRGIMVPESSNLRLDALREAHDQPTSAHMGVKKTLARISQSLYWPGMSRDVADYVARCGPCQRSKHLNQRPAGLLKPLPIVGKGEMITIDFVGELPKSRRGRDAVLVVVDKLTKRAYYEPCNTTATAKQTAEMVFRRVVREQGLPLTIVSDRDTRFTSRLWDELWTLCGTKLGIATAYHQQTDGQSERQVRTLEESLRMFVNTAGNDWDDRIVHVEIAHNTACHASTGFAPLKLHSGVDANLPISLAELGRGSGSGVSSAQRFLFQMSEDVEAARASLRLAQERQKVAYDRRHRSVGYIVGDWAYIATADTIHRDGGKVVWKPIYEGPYCVLEVSDDGLNVTLDIQKSRRHPVFHVSKLKKAKMPLNDVVPSVVRREVRHKQSSDNLARARDVEGDSHDSVCDDGLVVVVTDSSPEPGTPSLNYEQQQDGVFDGSDGLSEPNADLSSDSENESENGAGNDTRVVAAMEPPFQEVRRGSRRRIPPERLMHDGRLGDHFGLNLVESQISESIKHDLSAERNIGRDRSVTVGLSNRFEVLRLS